MKLQHTLLACTMTALVSGTALAQNTRAYDASIALGYVGTSGNTDTTTFNTEALLTYRAADWTHNGKFEALGSQQDSQTKAEHYFLEEKSDYNFDANQYFFGKGSYNADRFSGYSYQATAAAGYGRYLVKQTDYSLQSFAGVGYRQSQLKTGVDSEGEAILTIGENASWQISASSALVQSFNTDIGKDFTTSTFEVGLKSNIIDRIATKIAFQARNVSAVPAGNKKTDTQTSISLVYTF